jgi:hypothetical protein
MIKTVWKPRDEIAHSFRGVHSATIFSCTFCANLSGTGGSRGIKIMKRILAELNVNVVRSECVLVCCEENVMRQAMSRYEKAISQSDALVILSCAAGVKAAFLAKQDIRIVNPLNPVGSAVVSHADDPVARGLCTVCGNCVIAYTGGICPVSECPAATKYGPCKKAADMQGKCALRPGKECIWEEIKKRADIKELKKLQRIHREFDEAAKAAESGKPVSPPRAEKASVRSLRSNLAWFGARIQSIEKLIAVYR